MSEATVIYCTTTKLDCGATPANVILCVPSSLIVNDRPTIEATLISSSYGNETCGGVLYNYTFTYDDAVLLNPDEPLVSSQINGVICNGCLISWVESVVGDNSYIITNEDGSQIFVSGDGTEYPINTASINVTDTSSIDFTLISGLLSAVSKISVTAGNILTVNADGLYVPSNIIQTILDTNSIDLTLTGSQLKADVKISADVDNCIEIRSDGLYSPCSGGGGAPAFRMFGAGSDDIVISYPTALTSDLYANNLTFGTGASVFTQGFKIIVRDTLTIASGVVIHNDGTDGANGTNTAGGPGGNNTVVSNISVGLGGEGGDGGSSSDAAYKNGVLADYSYIFTGGSGGRGGDGGAASTTEGYGGNPNTVNTVFRLFDLYPSIANQPIKGGAGGSGGGAGGGSGVAIYNVTGTIVNDSAVPMSGVTVQASAGLTDSAVTNGSGQYALGFPYTATPIQDTDTFTITPSLADYNFSPANYAITIAGASQTKDFTGTPISVPSYNPNNYFTGGTQIAWYPFWEPAQVLASGGGVAGADVNADSLLNIWSTTRTFQQTTDASRATVRTNTINGYQSLDFASASTYSLISTPNTFIRNLNTITVGIVFKPDAVTGSMFRTYESSYTYNRLRVGLNTGLVLAGTSQDGTNDSLLTGGTTVTTTDWHAAILQWNCVTQAVTLYLDNASTATSSTFSVAQAIPDTACQEPKLGISYDGKIAEIFFMGNVLMDNTQRANWFSDVKTLFNLTTY